MYNKTLLWCGLPELLWPILDRATLSLRPFSYPNSSIVVGMETVSGKQPFTAQIEKRNINEDLET